ncbi:MAG: LytTR family DNA-binding domain-containing protein [Acidobacteriota bacterium]
MTTVTPSTETGVPSSQPGTLDALIVDDEDLARQRVRDLVEQEPRLRICGECRNGCEAVNAISRLRPDLVFLDVQMPDLDGFGVIRQVGKDNMPPVIFVTAFDEFALRAFDAAAVDYLLKPFDRGRFVNAVDRALERCRQHQVNELERCVEKLSGLGLNTSRQYPERLAVRHGSTVHLLKVHEINWVEAARNYVKIHCGREIHTMRDTLTNVEARLDPDQFLRIHRSTLVNVDRIRRIEPGYGSESRVELDDGTRLMVSRAYRRGKVRQLLDQLP